MARASKRPPKDPAQAAHRTMLIATGQLEDDVPRRRFRIRVEMEDPKGRKDEDRRAT